MGLGAILHRIQKNTSAVVNSLNYRYPDIKLMMLEYFGPAGLPVDRSLLVNRPVAGRPVIYRSTGKVPVDRQNTGRPVGPVDRPVRSGLTYLDRYRYRS